MKIRLRELPIATAALFCIAAGSPAFAHHAMGGALPDTAMQALASGLAHPIIGLDHLAFIVGVGLLSALIRQPLLAPLTFIAGTLGGAALHIAGTNIPLVELAIALSAVAAGAAVFFRRTGSFALLAALLGLAGIMHGYAYAESIIGAEPGPLYAYLAGLAVIQYMIGAGVALAAGRIPSRETASGFPVLRLAGAAIALVGLAPLAGLV